MLTELLSGLWISNINDAYNEEFYKDNLINIVINCTIDQAFLDLPKIKKLRIPLSSNLEPDKDLYLLKQNIDKILNYIHENKDDNNILIFCYNGLTISPLIVAIYMIKYGNISKDNIRDILRSKNKDITLDIDLSLF
jgi:protein-tyrosine phosphatase